MNDRFEEKELHKARKQREREKWFRIKQTTDEQGLKQYPYVDSDGYVHATTVKENAAIDNARYRYYNLNKFEKAVSKLTGQKARLDKLADQAFFGESKEDRKKAGEELDKMFGGKGATL